VIKAIQGKVEGLQLGLGGGEKVTASEKVELILKLDQIV
jgi:hypothetical protein